MPPLDTQWQAVGMFIDGRDNTVWIVAIDNANDIWLLKKGAATLNQPLNTWVQITPDFHA